MKIFGSKIVRTIGGEPLTLKLLWRILENPVYAGVNPEKWTQGQPVRCKFAGLISIDLFNAANHGKIVIVQNGDEISIVRRKPAEYLLNKGARNDDFPYKRIVMCPECNKPLLGSASRGKLGKYYPAYHCNRKHYFRVRTEEFDKSIRNFVSSLKVNEEYIMVLLDRVDKEYAAKQVNIDADAISFDMQITEIEQQIRQAVDKIKYLNSKTAIKYMEEEINGLEAQLESLRLKRQDCKPQKGLDIDKYKNDVRYMMEHLEDLLIDHCNPVQKAKLFGVLFDKAPNFKTIVNGTLNPEEITELNGVFKSKKVLNRTYGWG